jgi:hypothetical protein
MMNKGYFFKDLEAGLLPANDGLDAIILVESSSTEQTCDLDRVEIAGVEYVVLHIKSEWIGLLLQCCESPALYNSNPGLYSLVKGGE